MGTKQAAAYCPPRHVQRRRKHQAQRWGPIGQGKIGPHLRLEEFGQKIAGRPRSGDHVAELMSRCSYSARPDRGAWGIGGTVRRRGDSERLIGRLIWHADIQDRPRRSDADPLGPRIAPLARK
jgi:hypothetical protein